MEWYVELICVIGYPLLNVGAGFLGYALAKRDEIKSMRNLIRSLIKE